MNILPGTPGAAVLPELGPEPTDLVLSRWHGVGPMGGTDLDAVLRNLGVSTIVVVGVSLNIAIPNIVMDAVNAAYRVIVPRDAVAGIPTEYGNAIIDNTLSLLATITTTDDLLQTWSQPERRRYRDRRRRHRARRPRWISRRPTCRRRTSGTGPVHRGAAPFAGSDGLHQPGRRTVGRRGRASRERVRAPGRPPGSRDRRRGGPGAEHSGVGPSADAAVDGDGLGSRRRHHGRSLHRSPRGRQPGGARRHHSAAVRLAVRDDGDRRGHPADADRVSCTSTTARSPRSTSRCRPTARSPTSTAGKFS